MDEHFKLVDLTTIEEMLFGNPDYIKEFGEAAVISFNEFKENYSYFLLQRDEANFRKTGHKVKPVAQMLGLGMIIEEYEHAKTLLINKKPLEELAASAKKMDDICDKVLVELKEINR